jgi:hypothetical protein
MSKAASEHFPGVRPQAEHGAILTRERRREHGTVREARMKHLLQFGVRDADLPAPDGRHNCDSRVLEGVTKSVSTDHSGRADDDRALRDHDRSHSSSQST